MKPRSSWVRPLSDEERIAWEEAKLNFRQFGKGAMKVFLYLADVKRRELYREEWGAGKKGWNKFWAHCRYFDLLSWSRATKSQNKAAIETAEPLLTQINNELLGRVNKTAWLALRRIVKNTAWHGDLLNFMFEKGIQPEQINEDAIDRYWPQLLQQKEEEDKQRKSELSIVIPDEEDETEEQDSPPSDPIRKCGVRQAAQNSAKQPRYVERAREYARLLERNSLKISDADLEKEEQRAIIMESVKVLRRTLDYLEGRLKDQQKERKGAS